MQKTQFMNYFMTLMNAIIGFAFYEFDVYGYKITLFGVFIFLWVAELLLTTIWQIFGEGIVFIRSDD